MRTRGVGSRKVSGKPVKRVSALKKTRTGAGARHYLVRGWWILRGVVAGVVILGLVYGGYLGVGWITRLDSLSVKVIEVQGCSGVQPESVLRLAAVSKGQPLLNIDLGAVRRRVLSHPAVKNATVVRALPDRLRISIEEREPAAVVLGKGYALVDGEGAVMALLPSYPEGYPLITGLSGVPGLGKTVVQALPALEILKALSRVSRLGPQNISELRVTPGKVQVSLMGSGAILVFGWENAEEQVGRLTRLMAADAFDGRSAGYDLRFEGRVIQMPERKG